MINEQVLWAIPKGKTGAINETVVTSTTCKEHFENARKWAKENGFHSLRVQVLDGSIPCFKDTIN